MPEPKSTSPLALQSSLESVAGVTTSSPPGERMALNLPTAKERILNFPAYEDLLKNSQSEDKSLEPTVKTPSKTSSLLSLRSESDLSLESQNEEHSYSGIFTTPVKLILEPPHANTEQEKQTKFPASLTLTAEITKDGVLNLHRFSSGNLPIRAAVLVQDKHHDAVDNLLGYRVLTDGPLQLRVGSIDGLITPINSDGSFNPCALPDAKMGIFSGKDIYLKEASARFAIPIDIRVGLEGSLYNDGKNKFTVSGNIGVVGFLGEVEARVRVKDVRVMGTSIGSASLSVTEENDISIAAGWYGKYTRGEGDLKQSYGVGITAAGESPMLVFGGHIPIPLN